MILLPTDPEPLEIELKRTAVIIIDMQNAFVSRGGMMELWGNDITPMQKAIAPIQKVIDVARAKDCKIIYIAHKYSLDLQDSGIPYSPNWYKEKSLKSYREHPEWRDKLIISGTWGSEIVDELKPQEEDVVIIKLRFSAFSSTTLDKILRANEIKYLIFTGVTANTCVETSIRDAFHHEYFAVLISDATASSPPSMKEATIENVVRCFGWVITADNFSQALK
jgi:ureidoacrylate peracid hydrolase